jgi:phenylpropionate dioxygenase-like ring-hydroxylating dioxygenase large terminal subunit
LTVYNYPAPNPLGKWHYGQAVERVDMLRDYWYIACASSRLGAAPRAVRVFDANLVLFRDSAGVVAALRDRCCHRGVKLSLGRVVDDNLACRYHGWRYDGGGQCVHIPSLIAGEATPGRARVDSFRCHEQQGYVWVWMGDPAKMRDPPPQIASFSEKRWWQGSVAMQCPALMGIENNLDWCHPYFAHPWRHGGFFATWLRGFSEQCFEVRATETGLIAFAPATADADQPVPDNPVVALRLDLPDRVTVIFNKPWQQTIVLHFLMPPRVAGDPSSLGRQTDPMVEPRADDLRSGSTAPGERSGIRRPRHRVQRHRRHGNADGETHHGTRQRGALAAGELRFADPPDCASTRLI